MRITICCYQDANGVWNECAYHEACDEFNANVPDWEARLAEHDNRESGDFDFDPDPDAYGHTAHVPNSDMEWFLSVTYTDPTEV